MTSEIPKPRRTIAFISLPFAAIYVVACSSLQQASAPVPERITESTASTNETPARLYDSDARVFSAEEPLSSPVPVPDDVQRLIYASDVTYKNRCPPNEASHCFEAAEVSLTRDSQHDLIVIGRGKMQGANMTKFWLFKKENSRYRLVSFATGLMLELGEPVAKAYSKVYVSSVSASAIQTTVYEYNGKRYAETATESDTVK